MKSIETKDIYEAYRKLKNYFYYDNTTLSIRYKIAEYEERFYGEENISFYDKFKNATVDLLKIVNGKDKNGHIMASLLSKIGFTYITKSVEKPEFDGPNKIDNQIIINGPIDTTVSVSKLNMLIDAPIEIHLISMLWVMYVGKRFRSILEKNNYSYLFDFDEDKKDLHKGLQLFKPYYYGYQKWRDTALNIASSLLDNGRDASILCLDIQRYYYSVRLNTMDLLRDLNDKKHLEIDLDNGSIRLLCQLVQLINLQYTQVVQQYIDKGLNISDEEIAEGKTILPVGLLSSAILANLYLCDFDDCIMNDLRPAFYGRYVDDMLFVFSDQKIEQSNTISNFMDYFVKRNVLEKVEKDIDGNDCYYKFVVHRNLKIQEGKVVLQHFFHNESKAAINKFRQNIDRQRSEFRFLPDEDIVDEEFDSDAFSLQYTDSIQKLRSLQGFKENKYGASKFLASKIFIACTIKKKAGTEESRRHDSQQILSFFKGRTCIEFCTLWEKIATYFFVTEDPYSLRKFIMQATEAINNIEGNDINEDKISRYKDDLNNYLMISVASPYALNTDFNLMGFKEESTSICYNKALCLRHANMFRHYLVGTPGINYTKALFDNKTNLYDRSIPLDTEEKDILFYLAPCYFRYDKANLMAIFKCLSNKCGNRIEKMQNNIHEDTEKLYNDINYKWRKLFDEKENYSDSMIKVGGTEADNKWMYFEVEDRYWEGHVNKRIAIANMKVSDKQVEQSMLKKPNLSTERCKTLFSIINEAVKDKCDILVLPELSVPHQWLDLLVGQSKKHQMAIIAGVEYYHDNDGYVYNCVATILPFRMRNGRTTAINIRIKNHYSPHERKVLEGYRYKIPSSKLYCLFHWRKVFFSVYNCFELADINDRSLFKAKVDFIVATELNRDVNYFADIAGSWVRDIHCFFIQVNTSHFGDSCIMQPSKSETCKMVSVKGGKNSTILVEDLEIDRLRSFQLKEHITQMDDSTYKLTPPDFSRIDVIRRINDDDIDCFRGDSADKF